MGYRPIRFPKVKSPFEREEDEDGDYVVYDEVKDGFEWVFENDDVLAVEKLHGTNCCISIQNGEHGKEIEGYTRHGHEPMQRIEPYGPMTEHHYLTRAFQNSLRRGYLDDLDEGTHYGEVVGTDFHGNAHELEENLFIPFQWLADKCAFNSWGEYPKTFASLEKWFSDQLFSLFYARMHGKDIKDTSVSQGVFCEGIIFLHPDGGYSESNLQPKEEQLSSGMYRKYSPHHAKLRRDMFSGFAKKEWPMTDYSNH
jgi:hypothetical protein